MRLVYVARAPELTLLHTAPVEEWSDEESGGDIPFTTAPEASETTNNEKESENDDEEEDDGEDEGL
jgi:hypothetical protein